jgi:putative SOS response-associated peptidase YedK
VEKAASRASRNINARAETVAEKPMFRSAFKSRRCIIPASGFYEGTGAKSAKTPHYFVAEQ